MILRYGGLVVVRACVPLGVGHCQRMSPGAPSPCASPNGGGVPYHPLEAPDRS